MSAEGFMTQPMLVILVIFIANLSHPDLFGQTTNDFIIPIGTKIEVILETTLNSENNKQGDRFTAKVTKGIYIHGKEVIPKETVVEGRVAKVDHGSEIMGNSQINLAYERFIFPDGVSETVVASQTEFENRKKKQQGHRGGTLNNLPSLKRDLIPIGSGTEAFAGKNKKNFGFSEEIPRGIIGSLTNIFRRGNEKIELLSGTLMVIQMDRPLTIPSTKSD